MYNYKFDSRVTKDVLSKCDEFLHLGNIDKLQRKINKIINNLYFDNDVYEDLLSRRREDSNDQCITKQKPHNEIKLNLHYAFTEEDIGSYEDLNNKYRILLNSLNFEKSVLNVKKNKVVKELDINNAVKIMNAIQLLDKEIARILFEIEKCNKFVFDKEQDFIFKCIDFVEKLKNDQDVDKKFYLDGYGDAVIKYYKTMQLEKTFSEFFEERNQKEISVVLLNNEIKSSLKDYYDNICNRFLGDVGANS